MTPEEYHKFSRIETVWLAGSYEPESKEISVDRFDVVTPIGSFGLSGLLTFAEDRLDRLLWKTARMDLELELTPSELSWGDPEKTGRFTLERAELNSSWNWTFDERVTPLPKGSASLLFEGFKAEFAGLMEEQFRESEVGRIVSRDTSGISVDRFSVAWELDDEELRITDSELLTPYLKTFLTMSADLDNSGIDYIQSAKLTLTEWSPEVDKLIQESEQKRGEKFAREGENIVFEMSGTPDEVFSILRPRNPEPRYPEPPPETYDVALFSLTAGRESGQVVGAYVARDFFFRDGCSVGDGPHVP